MRQERSCLQLLIEKVSRPTSCLPTLQRRVFLQEARADVSRKLMCLHRTERSGFKCDLLRFKHLDAHLSPAQQPSKWLEYQQKQGGESELGP